MNRTRRPTTADHGFTLIELLVVVIIIGILAAIAIPVFMHQKAKAHDAAVKSDLATIAKAIEGDATLLTGPIFRAAGNAAVVDAAGNASAVKLSDGTGWGVSGTSAQYCISGWSLDGSHDAADPYTYDSAAGGLERDGKACNLTSLPVTSIPWSGSGGSTFVAGRSSMSDSTFQTVTAAKLDAVVPASTQNDNIIPTAGGQWRYLSQQTPVGVRSVELVTTSSTVTEGVIFLPSETNPIPASVPTIIDGQKYTLSTYVKAPAGRRFRLTARVITPVRTWVTELANSHTGSGRWERVSFTMTGTPATAGKLLALQVQSDAAYTPGTSILIAGPQIELGDVSTPFEVTAP